MASFSDAFEHHADFLMKRLLVNEERESGRRRRKKAGLPHSERKTKGEKASRQEGSWVKDTEKFSPNKRIRRREIGEKNFFLFAHAALTSTSGTRIFGRVDAFSLCIHL